MTLPYSPSRAVYHGNGAATTFPFAFKVWNTDQLSVSLTSPDGRTTPAQGWSASLGESGGTVTYQHNGTPLPAGWRLAIVRDMPFAQGIDLVSASRFDPQVIEDGLDQATAELQQLSEKIARAVIMPATSDQSPEEVVATIYASRDAAAASADVASAQAVVAQASADAAASSAATAAQTVQTAATDAVSAATAQANDAHISALLAAQAAASAAAASGGLAPRMDATEQKIAQQGTRLDAAEAKNSQQDTRLTSAETALASKANTDLSNATGNAIAKYFYARDEKPSGTSGGATSSGSWNTRDINTIKNNYIGASLASNRVSLPAGRYHVRANAPSFAAETTRLAIYNATSSAYMLHGPTGRTNPGSAHIVQTSVEGEVVLDTPSLIELRMWTQSANSYGMGYPVAGVSGVAEIYSELRIWRM